MLCHGGTKTVDQLSQNEDIMTAARTADIHRHVICLSKIDSCFSCQIQSHFWLNERFLLAHRTWGFSGRRGLGNSRCGWRGRDVTKLHVCLELLDSTCEADVLNVTSLGVRIKRDGVVASHPHHTLIQCGSGIDELNQSRPARGIVHLSFNYYKENNPGRNRYGNHERVDTLRQGNAEPKTQQEDGETLRGGLGAGFLWGGHRTGGDRLLPVCVRGGRGAAAGSLNSQKAEQRGEEAASRTKAASEEWIIQETCLLKLEAYEGLGCSAAFSD
ncbi:uncharacterized protein LOC109927161 [Rhincodon typus]|uniref:uncharacterized protein LOC109927161 n=1 Tax=Rhincodon typus TaxID=259920 RepID=UPI00202F32F3|nr:uncharacterized protein LOC109927161 [Rhincodon typus]